jgi:hypothetical protein
MSFIGDITKDYMSSICSDFILLGDTDARCQRERPLDLDSRSFFLWYSKFNGSEIEATWMKSFSSFSSSIT